jgi:hypothetical protein
VLVHVSRDAFLYEEELQALPFEQQRVGRNEVPAVLTSAVEKYPTALYFIAGSEAFVEEMSNFLVTAKIHPACIVKDEFTGLTEE